MEAGTIIVPYNQAVQCTQCSCVSLVKKIIRYGDIPVFIECPSCLQKRLVDGTEVWPKISPSVSLNIDNEWNIIQPGKAKEADDDRKDASVTSGIDITSKDSLDSLSGKTTEQVIDESEPHYNVLAKQLKENLKAGIAIIAQMEVALEKFGADMEADMLKHINQARIFSKYWRQDYFKDFLVEPVNSIRLDLPNEQLALGTRLVLSPTFLAVNFGIPISLSKGMRTELVTPFTRISRGINGAFAEILDLPEELMLYVQGKKILGKLLRNAWKDIPGIIHDVDSTIDDPSVLIDDFRAREWLAVRGVRAWSARPIADIITKDDFNANAHKINEDILPEFAAPWIKLERCGRVGVWWNDVDKLRKFCLFALGQIRGARLIVTCSTKDDLHWRTLDQANTRYSVLSSLTIFDHFDEDFIINEYLTYNVIVLDLCNIDWGNSVMIESIESIVNTMFHYSGVVIVIGNDPLLDIEGTGSLHISAHTLSGFEVYDNIDVEVNPRYKHSMMSKLIKSLRSFRLKKNS